MYGKKSLVSGKVQGMEVQPVIFHDVNTKKEEPIIGTNAFNQLGVQISLEKEKSIKVTGERRKRQGTECRKIEQSSDGDRGGL